MGQKYPNYIAFVIAKLIRTYQIFRLYNLVRWNNQEPLEPGVTAIIGIDAKSWGIVKANLRCLIANQWSDLKTILIIVNQERNTLTQSYETQIKQEFPETNIRFLYYNSDQYKIATRFNVPYIYSWLSWSIVIGETKTQTVLFHDFDALILSKSLKTRYLLFKESGVKVQSIDYYKSNGLTVADNLGTTFEAFVDVSWLKSFPPIMLFNRVYNYNDRLIEFDTLLYLQAICLNPTERTIVPMSFADLVHPTQMIHQYTMFKRLPGKALPCTSVIMIPFFYFLSGETQILTHATQALQTSSKESINLLNDGVIMNLSRLTTVDVDWVLKQILQAIVSLQIPPCADIVDYGTALYKVCATPPELYWLGDFLPEHRKWLTSVV